MAFKFLPFSAFEFRGLGNDAIGEVQAESGQLGLKCLRLKLRLLPTLKSSVR